MVATAGMSEVGDNEAEWQLVVDREAWAQTMAAMPDPQPLQSAVWADFKSRWGWQADMWRLGRPATPAAAIMMLRRRLGPLPLTMAYAPRGPMLATVEDSESVRKVLAGIVALGRRTGAVFVKIDPHVVVSEGVEPAPVASGVAFRQALLAGGWHYSGEQIQFGNTVEMGIDGDPDAILAGMKQKTRYNIRLAGRRGVTVRAGTPADWPMLGEMYRETAVRDGFAIRPVAYYLDAWQAFAAARMGHTLIAEYEGVPLAGVFLVRTGQRVVYMYGASTDRERQRMPNYLLQWEALRWAHAQGASIYDFWGAPDNFDESDRMWGVWRFKAGFNGRVVRLVGAWDYPLRPFWYRFYTTILPRYMAFMRRRNRGERDQA